MITCKGEIKFNRELLSGEVVEIQRVFNNTATNTSKPNNGIFPFKLNETLTGFVWDETEAYEIENLLKVIIEEVIPKNVTLNGLFIYEEKTGDYYNGYKVYVDNNKIYMLKIDEELPDKAPLLRCPHCQKVFKKESFTEVFE